MKRTMKKMTTEADPTEMAMMRSVAEMGQDYFLFFCSSEYKSVDPNAIALPFNYHKTVIFYYLYRSNFRLASLLRTEESLIS